MGLMVLHKGSAILSVGWCGFKAQSGQECREITPMDIPGDVTLGWQYDADRGTIVQREAALAQAQYDELVFGPPEPAEPTGPTPEERITELETQVAALAGEIETLKGGVAEMRKDIVTKGTVVESTS